MNIFYRLGILVVLVALSTGCGGGGGGKPEEKKAGGKGGRGDMKFPVDVIPVETRRVQYSVNAVGSVEAFEQVQVTSRVSGVAEAVNFTEGQSVNKETVLVEIEPERFRLAVKAAKASLKKAETARAEAEAGLKRRMAVNEANPGLIPGEEIETWNNRLNTAAADILQAETALALAELNLHDAIVRAPIAGVIQTKTVQTGQYVQPGTVLATLLRREPLQIRFQVPQQDAGGIRKGMKVYFRVRGNEEKFSAIITYVAEAADADSRMVNITGRIDRGRSLRPGTFAELEIPVGGSSDAPVIPQTAIRPGDRGFVAFVVEKDVARERILTLGLRTADGKVEIRSGLKPGEMLVIRGAEALQDGAPVRTGAKS